MIDVLSYDYGSKQFGSGARALRDFDRTSFAADRRRCTEEARIEGSAPLQRLSVYEARAVILSLAFSFSFAISVWLAKSPARTAG
jgi:hypothetical protein